jgi:hypothetical protein
MIIVLLLCIPAILSSLMFEVNHIPKCYVEELFHDSVAMVKWKITGLPTAETQKKGKKKNIYVSFNRFYTHCNY